MRPLLLSMVFFPWAACAPKVTMAPSFDEDLAHAQVAGPHTDAPAPANAVNAPRPVAVPGKGLRTGTIPRDRLIAVLDAGPGTFLRQIEVMPKKDGERFVGWELVQLIDRLSPLVDIDVVPGDVLLAINGKPISRPDQLQTVWDSLRTANEVTAQLWRGNAQLTLAFAIEPKI
jgi:type II secretory pathway component PulC